MGPEYYITELVPGTPLLRVRGEIDQDGSAGFRAAVETAELRARCGMIVALDDARLFCAASYATVLAAAARLDAADRGPLLVVAASGSLASRVFRAVHFEHQRVATVVAAMALLRCEDGTSVAATYAEGFLRAAVS